jgi:hypothetical protein
VSLKFNVNVPRECPKCHVDRTMLDTSFALPGCIDGGFKKDAAENINATAPLPIRLIFCPRCHYLEMYLDAA